MSFPVFSVGGWILDSVDVNIAERDPTLEELSVDVPGFPDAAGLMADKRLWMASNSTWWSAYKNKYLYRRSSIVVAAHQDVDAANSDSGFLGDTYAAAGGSAVGGLPGVLQVGTTSGEKGQIMGPDTQPNDPDKYMLCSFNITHHSNGTATATASWKQTFPWYLVELGTESSTT